MKLVGRYGLCRTARTLRVDYYSLKKRVEAASAAEGGRPTATTADQRSASKSGRCMVGGQALSFAGPEEGTRATFVELPSPAHPSGECVWEWESAAGTKMRVHLKGVAMPDLTALARSFWDQRP